VKSHTSTITSGDRMRLFYLILGVTAGVTLTQPVLAAEQEGCEAKGPGCTLVGTGTDSRCDCPGFIAHPKIRPTLNVDKGTAPKQQACVSNSNTEDDSCKNAETITKPIPLQPRTNTRATPRVP